MCDLKWEHFGIGLNLSTSSSLSYSEDFRYQHPPTRIPTDVKLLDLDAVLSESSLKLNMDSTPCETDEDCDYFDCKGRCVQVVLASVMYCVGLLQDNRYIFFKFKNIPS